jgi:SAM-dependent methyltransferase
LKNCDEWLEDLFVGRKLMSALLSAPDKSALKPLRKVEVNPIIVKSNPLFQFAYFGAAKVIHRNLDSAASIVETRSLLSNTFRQCEMRSAKDVIYMQRSKAGDLKVSVKPSKIERVEIAPRHDREKNRILPDGVPVEFLIRLGVMAQNGRVLAARYDKFKQINRFLEMAADVADRLKPDGALSIVDFGSGKSYLTFALYHYFTKVRGRTVSLVGLDLKADVVEHCNEVASDLNFSGLSFVVGDIAGYSSTGAIDMVVSLHACDTATDDALSKAVSWGAEAILAVPCCQHELFNQIRSDVNRPLLKHGILKERLAALVTDALRAEWLESMGYSVQVMEFIETAHTPKNLLIRAVRNRKPNTKLNATAEYAAFRDYWHVNPHIDRQTGVSSISNDIPERLPDLV